jgi:hypothetical protein
MSAQPTQQAPAWYTDYPEVLAFARVLVDSDYFSDDETSLGSLLYYFSKPYKWEGEHAAWVAAGRPDAFDFESASEVES